MIRNPLAEPGVLGVSATAALGAVLAIFVGASGQPPAIAATAMAFALGAVALLGLIAGSSGLQLVLAGVVLASLSAALTSLLIGLAPTPFALGEIVTWLMGALTDRTLADVLAAGFGVRVSPELVPVAPASAPATPGA